MLTSLTIHNVVLIESLRIDFFNGFCALTGETGAGKSILLDSLGLASGMRAEAGLVRKGADQASVTALFQPEKSHAVFEVLSHNDLNHDGNIILRRILNKDGRSRAYVNDQAVSIGLLREIGDHLIEIHGQFETQGLLNPATHRDILDEYAGVRNALGDVWRDWASARQHYQDLKISMEEAVREESYLRQSLEDLDVLDPQIGEEEQLSSLRESLIHREKILEALNSALHDLNGDNDPLSAAARTLDRIADKAGPAIHDSVQALERAGAEMQEAVSLIQSLLADLSETDHDLETIDERLFTLKAQARKHGCAMDDLPSVRNKIAEQLAQIDHADDQIKQAEQHVEKAKTAYQDKAETLSQKRQKAAADLDRKILKELPPLKLEKARFVTQIERLAESEWNEQGMDRVRFLVATNPGADPGPLNKIASGGEMARFMLAMKVVMAATGIPQTLIFDEVDAGIGGGTADAVGERLARLARDKQILAVTHAPQVAARAGHHMIVSKDGADEVRTNVVALQTVKDRQEEIARMLAGASVTDEARAAAAKLLDTGS